MIQMIPTQADNVLAFTATGKVTGADYESTLIPAVEEALNKYDKLRLLYQLGPDFESYDLEAMWDDTKVGMEHITHWEKIAVVTDEKWVVRSVKAFGFMIPGEVKVYSNAKFDTAMKWVAE